MPGALRIWLMVFAAIDLNCPRIAPIKNTDCNVVGAIRWIALLLFVMSSLVWATHRVAPTLHASFPESLINDYPVKMIGHHNIYHPIQHSIEQPLFATHSLSTIPPKFIQPHFTIHYIHRTNIPSAMCILLQNMPLPVNNHILSI